MKTLDIDLAMKFIEYLDKPAHVSTLELVGKVDIHVHRGDGVLTFLRFVPDRYRVGDGLDPDLFDIDSAAVQLALYVFHSGRWRNLRLGAVMRSAEFEQLVCSKETYA